MNDSPQKNTKSSKNTESQISENNSETNPDPITQDQNQLPTCGIVMPIAGMGDDYPATHWVDIKEILTDVAESAGFKAGLVSDADEVTVIQKTIIQNLYNSDIVIVDVSNKNANVMFELGIRLAFDKPTIIVKDFETNFIFDTGVIEHLQYPKDLRYQTIRGFKEKLKNKLIDTLAASKKEEHYSPFLKNFGQYKVASLDSKEVTGTVFLEKILNEAVSEIKRYIQPTKLTNNQKIYLTDKSISENKVEQPSRLSALPKLNIIGMKVVFKDTVSKKAISDFLNDIKLGSFFKDHIRIEDVKNLISNEILISFHFPITSTTFNNISKDIVINFPMIEDIQPY